MSSTIPMEARTPKHWLLVTDQSLDVAQVEPWLHDERAGGICLFVGTTRKVTGDTITAELRYEAFSEMAVAQMEKLALEAAVRWPLVKVALHHRVGTVGPAETSVLVGVSAPHRAEAFESCRYLIDTLKEVVPVWKKEISAAGTGQWVEPSRDSQASTD